MTLGDLTVELIPLGASFRLKVSLQGHSGVSTLLTAEELRHFGDWIRIETEKNGKEKNHVE